MPTAMHAVVGVWIIVNVALSFLVTVATSVQFARSRDGRFALFGYGAATLLFTDSALIGWLALQLCTN